MPILDIKWSAWDTSINKEELQNEKDRIYLWNNIYYLRKYRWLSQTELANLSWTTQRIISEIESALYENPWLDLINKIASSLEVDTWVLLSKSIKWRVVEFFDYFLHKYWSIDILKANKIAYFTDLEFIENFKKKFTGLNYYRYKYWPFNKDLYKLSDIFEVDDENVFSNKKSFKKYVFLNKEDQTFLDKVFSKYWNKTSTELMKMSYETAPMKKLWATLGGDENMWVIVL